MMLWMRRYPEARDAYERALGIAPLDFNILEQRAMVDLARGDLTSARAVLRRTPRGTDRAGLVAAVASYFDLGWALDDADQRVVLGLGPAAFGDDRLAWALALTQVHAFRGDERLARAYADSARMAADAALRTAPMESQLRVLHGVALAYLGAREAAVREGERGVALLPVTKNANDGPYMQHQLVRIYLLLGEPEKALAQLEPLLRMPYYLSPGWLRIDPTFAPLEGNPRFDRLTSGT
jgi:tetratricopeptide (TPR) repeat protein